jgi:hypothetical protein
MPRIPIDNDAEVRVDRTEYNGEPRINVRLWRTPDGAEPYPTRYGLSIHPDLWRDVLPALVEAIEDPCQETKIDS